MVSKSQYRELDVRACKAVLLELVRLLAELKEEMVLIGGWAPTFLLPQSSEPHIGSLDIDVALNFAMIPDDTYQTIMKAFLKRDYVQDKQQPFRFFRTVKTEGTESIIVELDLMAGEYGGTGRGHRMKKDQDGRARKA